MSATEFLIDATTRNAVFTQRLAFGEAKKAQTELNRVERLSIGSIGDRSIIRPSDFIDYSASILNSAVDTGTYTAGYTQRLMNLASTADFVIPSDENLAQRVASIPMQVVPGEQPLTIGQATQQYATNKSLEINRTIQEGLNLGLAESEIKSNLKSQFKLFSQQSEALVRTTTNASANMGRIATLEENSQFLQGYEWVSKLDSRTTLICAGLDGNIYEFGQGPLPPAHWNCRSQIVAALLPRYQKTGLEGERNAEGGEVTPNTTYGGWLKQQPAAFQDEALGDTRAALFRRGGLKIDSFTDPEGRTYTIDQLRQLEPLAFARANL